MLKLDVAFLYDLLGASQEHKIKPKKFSQTDIDEVIIGHTNEPEYRKLQSNEFMEALRDRTVKIDVPYNTRLRDEVSIYERDFNPGRIKGKHIAPHTLEMAAMWAVLTRLEEPKKASLNLVQKMKLYNGQTLPGFTEDNIKELRSDSEREGMDGISPRYIQDKVSNALVNDESEGCVNPFMVLNELESGLKHHSLLNSEDLRKRYREMLTLVKEEYEDVVKNEVQRAISADEESIKRLCANYVDNIKAYTQKEKVKNKYTGEDEEPDERLMRSIEEKIGIPENRKDDFRREIMNYIGALAVEGKTFDYRTNSRLPEGARTENVRGPEGFDKAHQPRVERDRQGDARKDRRCQTTPGPKPGVLRCVCDGRSELRGQHLCPRRLEAVRSHQYGATHRARPASVSADRTRRRQERAQEVHHLR